MSPKRVGAMPGLLLRSSLLSDVASALRLLPPGSRIQLSLLVAANMATSLLDLIGVALVGIVSISLVTYAQSDDGATTDAFPSNIVAAIGFGNDIAGLFFLALAAAIFLLLKSLIGALLSRRTLLFLARRQAVVSERLTIRLFQQPLSVVEKRTSQETVYALISGVGAAIVSLLGSGALALAELSLLVVLGIGLLLLNFWVTVAAVVFFAVLALVIHRFLGSWARQTGDVTAATNVKLMQGIQEASSSFRELTVTNRMEAHTKRLADPILVAATSTATLVFITQVPKYVYESALLFGALALGAFEFSQRTAAEAVVTVSVFFAAGSRIMPSMLRLQNCLVSIRSSAGLSTPTFALYKALGADTEQSPDSRSASADRSASVLVPTVELRGVTASYPDADEPAIQEVDLTLEAGMSAAIVGPTGAGKSTLADVVLGILPVQSGLVRLGSLEPSECIKAWPGSIAYVPQVVSLVSGTVRQNVAIGVSDAEIDDEAVWSALRAAHLDEFLRSEREGLDTEVGERGVRLSGGQRQRLGLARALYSKPRLLVLDEATSALDAETEGAISNTLSRLHGAVTTIVIAHRLTTIKDADTVVYIDGGRILAQGDFETVRRLVPRFDDSARILGL